MTTKTKTVCISLSALLFALCAFSVHARPSCDGPNPPPICDPPDPPEPPPPPTNPKTYHVPIHVIRTANDDGSQQAAFDPNSLTSALAGINARYRPARIQVTHNSSTQVELRNSTALNQDRTFPHTPTTLDPTEYQHIVYGNSQGNLIDTSAGAQWTSFDLTPSGFPAAAGAPSAYTTDGGMITHVVYRAAGDKIYEVWRQPELGNRFLNDLTTAASAPPAASDPSAYTTQLGNIQHVVYRGTDGHIYELYAGTSWTVNDLTAATGTPAAAGKPYGYVSFTNTNKEIQHVVYRGIDGHIHELWAGASWNQNDLTAAAQAPIANGDPTAYTTEFGLVQHVIYRGTDNRVHELFAGAAWRHNDLNTLTGIPETAKSDPSGYVSRDYDVNPGTMTQHVVFWASDDNVVELSATDVWRVSRPSVSAGAPKAASAPQGYSTDFGKTKHIAYVGVDGNVHELFTGSAGNTWGHSLISTEGSATGNVAVFTAGDWDVNAHDDARARIARQYPGRVVVYNSWGTVWDNDRDSVKCNRDGSPCRPGAGGSAFSNSILPAIVMKSMGSSGEALVLAHELGHYLHLWHTMGAQPDTVASAATLIKTYVEGPPLRDKNDGLLVFDGDLAYARDSPPDPGQAIWGAAGLTCNPSAVLTIPVTFSDSSQKNYVLPLAPLNVMSYTYCGETTLRPVFSGGQIKRMRAAIEHKNRRHLISP